MDLSFTNLSLSGVLMVRAPRHEDERGAIFRLFSRESFENAGLVVPDSQTSVSVNRLAGTVRGLHFQRSPFAEYKLVTCVTGAMFDVVVDLRSDSPARGQWIGLNLVADENQSVYIPPGCAHGFQALTDDTVVIYHITPSWHPNNEGGIKWDDPVLGIDWPIAATEVSERDRGLPAFSERAFS